MNYKDMDFSQVKAAYPGNLPGTATIDKVIPATTDFSPNPVYMYERPIPTSDATFLLVYGKYKDGLYYYYRIDLQNADGYYAIYRNFLYTIKIKGILRPGSATPTDAANSAGSGDISTDQKAENLTDVSDGVARILVEYTEKTIVGNAQTVKLKFKFLPNSSVDTPNNNAVTVEVGDPGATGAVINGSVTIGTTDDTQGWRELQFTSTDASDVTKTQTIKVTGTYNGTSKLFRNVTYKLMKIQNMQVVCDPHDLLKGKGEKVNVLIKIPKDLPRSIFPLQLQIESSELSITPDNDNLPVNPGKSIIDGTSATYQFIKTLDYDDYLALQEASTDEWVTVKTKFKTTKLESDCDVYVANPYFNTANDSFITYTIKNFSNLQFDKYNQETADLPVTFSFHMDATEIPQKVIVKLSGLKPATGSTLVQIATNTYEFTPTSGSTASIDLLTSTDDGFYRVDISANHYNDAFLDNQLDYINPGFTVSNVPFGVGKNVPFAFSYQTGAIEPVIFTLTNLTPPSGDTHFVSLGGNKWRFTPTGSNVAQSFNFVTTTFMSEVSVTMSGDSYTTVGPMTLNATSLTVASQSLAFTTTTGTRPQSGATVNVHTTTGVVVGSFTVNNNRYNSAAFDIDLSKFSGNENVYFSFYRNGNTYYTTSTYTLTQLSNATTGSRLTITGTTTTRPW